MKIKLLALGAVVFGASIAASAQTSQWGTPTGNPKFPKGKYIELPDPKPSTVAEWSAVRGVNLSWVSTDIRFDKSRVPAMAKKSSSETLSAWRGERVSAEALVWTSVPIEALNFEMSALTGKGGATIPASAAFVRYVMQDNFLTCGYRGKIEKWDSTLVADPIDHLQDTLPLDARSSRPVWVSVRVPRTAMSGLYKGVLTIKNGSQTLGKLNLEINVSSRTLTEVKDWKFHLDLWQNPYAEARYMGLTPFSKEHFDAMRPAMELLRDAGQKVITASIMHKPWGGQTEDYFESMITWIKRADGTWAFDFTTLNMWIEYMISIGIDKQIACYSMIPWDMSFKYYDQVSNSMKVIKTDSSTPEYREVWTALLRALSANMRAKGWFDRTVIAMDERAPKAMMDAFVVIKSADPEFKVSLAGGNHPEIEDELYDYSMASDNLFTPEVLAKRRAAGRISTFYTCCAQKYPNMFTYSPPAESEWIGWFSAAKNYDGYLRWAYNSYTKEPLLDARFRAFQSGDSYTIYPEGRSSIRMEKMIEGAEVFEKIHILRKEFTDVGDQKSLLKLDEILRAFDLSTFEKGVAPHTILLKARAELDKL